MPYNYIAIKYASLSFIGDLKVKKVLDTLVSLIRYEKYDINAPKIKSLKNKIELNKKKIASLRNNIVAIKNKHKLLFLHKESNLLVKELINKINRLNSQNISLQSKVDKLEDDNFFDAYELKYKFKDLLAKLDFTCKSSHKIGETATCEIYEYSRDEKQLLEKAKNMYDILKDKITIKAQKSLKDFELENDINR